MKSILFVIGRTYCYHLNCYYLKKEKNRSEFFPAYLKSSSSFEQFEIKDDPHRLCIYKFRDCERRG